MAAHLEDPTQEITRLRHCLNDLVSIIALQAMWAGADSSQIVRTLLGALLSMLGLDFAYAQWREAADAEPIQMARVAESCRLAAQAQDIGRMLFDQLGDDPQKWAPVIRSPLGGGDISVVALRLGMHGEIGLIAAGSERTGFPEQAERLVLNVAANEASVGLQEAWLLSEQKRLTSDLDRRVAQRTAELTSSNKQLHEARAALEKAFDEIERAEAKLRRVIDAIPTIAWCNLPDGPNEFLNKSWHQYTGLSPEQSHGWGWQVAFHPDDLPPLMTKWQEKLLTGEPGEIEARIRRHDGVYRWFLIRTEPFFAEGKLVRWYGTSADIEDRKRAEEAVRASENELREILDRIPGLVVTSSPSGEIQLINRQFMEFSGRKLDEIKKWETNDVIHPDDLQRVIAAFSTSLINGTPLDDEHRYRRADGVYRWFHVRSVPSRDKNGRITRWYALITDIEDRKRGKERLRRSEEYLAEGQRLSHTGSFSWRADTDEFAFSEEAYRIFEFDRDTPVTLERIGSRIHPEDIRLLSEKIARARTEASAHDYEMRLRMPDGSVKYLHTVSHGSRDQQGRLEYIGAIQDITRRRLSEEALGKARSELANVSRMTSLGVLTASIAHEVNQPLSGIVTNASTCLRLLSADPPNVEGARETAKRTIRDGNRAAEVIARLRTLFSRKNATFEMFDLNEAVKEVVTLSVGDLERNRVILQSDLAIDLPSVSGDRTQIQQVILNLLRNGSDAMKAVDDRPREMLIKTESDESVVRVSVKDTGMGFDSQSEKKLFEAFYTTKSDGMGIGLSISRSIIESHQGRLWAVRNEGPGATFMFSIPRGTNT